ncbi:hypothetical protein IFM89_025567 [Coptis chinensis]|uniref:Peptidase A1 domain-containing protein n=1 Tax=Coptis chinensis TaxID=261450 RepID=A0A835MFA3_9MAGN|nr:hypothetical protein IFM89_025567 [Coptis chinensis]
MAMIRYSILLLLLFISRTCYGFGTVGFNFHHRFSDEVKGVLSVDDLPRKGTVDYYKAMAHRDRIVIHGRGLATSTTGDQQQLSFENGNDTLRIPQLGFLHYANVSVGTPSLSFLVALDTGSDLFWVPCDCKSCVKALVTNSGAYERVPAYAWIFKSQYSYIFKTTVCMKLGYAICGSFSIVLFKLLINPSICLSFNQFMSMQRLDLNIYSPQSSSTSKSVPCDSSACDVQGACSGVSRTCPYQVEYLSNGTSSKGILIEDVLHLTTEGNHPEVVDAQITLGCGLVETGSFLNGAAPNGLFGLGMDKSSVPSILSSAGIAANSFSMCFGPDGIGRINFGDKGSVNQGETPFNMQQLQPMYNVSLTHVTVETNQSNVDFSAIFDSGTSFTYLNDPAYTGLSETFNFNVQDRRRKSDPNIPFEYCYDVGPGKTTILVPNVTLTMKGGSQFFVFDPIIDISDESGAKYCLAVVKSPDVNIIGQNFMTGYNIIFDREKLVLGWEKSSCYNIQDSSSPPIKSPNSTVVPPATAAEPRDIAPGLTKGTGNGSLNSGAPCSVGLWSHFSAIGCVLFALFLPFAGV